MNRSDEGYYDGERERICQSQEIKKPVWMSEFPPKKPSFLNQPRLSSEEVLRQLKEDGIISSYPRDGRRKKCGGVSFYVPLGYAMSRKPPRLLNKIEKTVEDINEKLLQAEVNRTSTKNNRCASAKWNNTKMNMAKERREQNMAAKRYALDRKHKIAEEKLKAKRGRKKRNKLTDKKARMLQESGIVVVSESEEDNSNDCSQLNQILHMLDDREDFKN